MLQVCLGPEVRTRGAGLGGIRERGVEERRRERRVRRLVRHGRGRGLHRPPEGEEILPAADPRDGGPGSNVEVGRVGCAKPRAQKPQASTSMALVRP